MQYLSVYRRTLTWPKVLDSCLCCLPMTIANPLLLALGHLLELPSPAPTDHSPYGYHQGDRLPPHQVISFGLLQMRHSQPLLCLNADIVVRSPRMLYILGTFGVVCAACVMSTVSTVALHVSSCTLVKDEGQRRRRRKRISGILRAEREQNSRCDVVQCRAVKSDLVLLLAIPPGLPILYPHLSLLQSAATCSHVRVALRKISDIRQRDSNRSGDSD